MDPSMPPPPPRNPNPSSSSMPPSPPPKFSPAAEPASKPESANPTSSMPPPPPPPPRPKEGASTSSSMPPPPPPPPRPAPPQPEVEGDASAEGGTGASDSSLSSSAADEGGNSGEDSGDVEMAEAAPPPAQRQQQQPRPRAPYAIPEWSAAPGHPFFLEVLKDGTIVDKLDVSRKGAYMFGRIDLCDFVLEHPTISRFHAVLQFRNDGQVFLYDLGSTHGSFINKTQVKKNIYVEIHVGDVIRFGQSSRLYIFQGPSELMPPEKDMQNLRDARVQQDMLDREASLLRAKNQAALAEGISWGMSEDAVEDSAEDEADEITWQTYKGQLTDRQEKTRSKIIKRLEKITNMKKEIDAIRAKDISQGGLTQGQQTQIARNEQRTSQLMEELENLEETLNDSIRESLGARTGNSNHGSHKASLEEEDDILSDEDDFYDRTKKKSSSHKSSEQQVETADSLLDKKDTITSDIESKKKLVEEEKNKLAKSENADLGDDLDAYMRGLSSQLVHDKIARIQKELSDLQTELDRVVYLLKIADPMGEAARKRDLKPRETKSPASNDSLRLESRKQNKVAQNKTSTEEKLKESCAEKTQVDKLAEEEKGISTNQENGSKPAFSMPKPQWLGDKRTVEPEENCIKEENANEETDSFVDYKDRKTILSGSASGKDLEEAAPGLILRKRKPADQSAANEVESSSVESEASAADAVALLLKHKRGLQTSEDMDDENEPQASQRKSKKSKQKRVLGPARPDFLDAGPDHETWVPPEGQTGDGRTSLNDRLGY
uniref:Putative adaptor protein kanadaptin n=1 Tax=Oryza officinalis TaxID=4535 RepID=D4N3V2_9ORYZ|nr:putative adaptor protein kanadaptin [Oryza officinalis]